MNDVLTLGLVYGSRRQGRFCETVAGWAASCIEADGRFRLSIIDPQRSDEAELIRRIAAADCYVVVTPEYNHGYPASLKALLDAAYEEWHAKPVGFVSYGGASGGIRAVEQLRQVFAELHATTVRDGVSFANAREAFDDDGVPLDAGRAQRAMLKMLARLQWWATALSIARRHAPYSETA